MRKAQLVPHPIEQRIFVVRGPKVILDSDLAELYGVTVKAFNQAVKRNAARFPADFILRLTPWEFACLRSQVVTSKAGRGGRRYLPFAFTEDGAIMAATVLNSTRAVEMSVFVVRAFVRLREVLAAHQQLANKIAELEAKLDTHDKSIQHLMQSIRHLVPLPAAKPRRIGFQPKVCHSPKLLKGILARSR
jgi:hypothetical protein